MNIVLRWWRAYQAEKARQQRIVRMFQLLRESDDDLQRIGRELAAISADGMRQAAANDESQEGSDA
ncbi:MAG TPA: hypothetical protein VMV29_08790 [Ktedonobacterales bacterium]|nr:hypothetical protein [Ktedonobacterales bacterium]